MSSIAQRKQRIEFCCQYQHWTSQQWQDVIFSNEKNSMYDFQCKMQTWRGIFTMMHKSNCQISDLHNGLGMYN